MCLCAGSRLIQTPESKKLALVIGNAGYPKALLKNPVNDAAATEATLKKAGFDVTIIGNAGLRRMPTAMATYRRCSWALKPERGSLVGKVDALTSSGAVVLNF